MPGNDIISDLKRDYRTKRALIERRLSDFQAVFERGDEAIFEELCFCILTAGSSAHMGLRTVSALRDILLTGSEAELQERARKHRVRFWRLRPSYIYCSREHLKSPEVLFGPPRTP
jgi:N-glycosylase/DNA lyase